MEIIKKQTPISSWTFQLPINRSKYLNHALKESYVGESRYDP
jgi:hypothetical protein